MHSFANRNTTTQDPPKEPSNTLNLLKSPISPGTTPRRTFRPHGGMSPHRASHVRVSGDHADWAVQTPRNPLTAIQSLHRPASLNRITRRIVG